MRTPARLLSACILTALTLTACSLTHTGPMNEAPEVFPDVKEWKGGYGDTVLSADSRIVFRSGDEGAEAAAQLLCDDLEALCGWRPDFDTDGRGRQGDIVLVTKQDRGLGTEGYMIESGRLIRLSAATPQGLVWAERTLMQMIAGAKTTQETAQIALPRGRLRDRPSYPVRGFQIDVARNPVSLDLLYEIVDALSRHKMNELTVHLNDNELLIYSGKSTYEEAFDAYAAFRPESAIKGENGIPLTAADVFYSREGFRALVTYAEMRGVSVIPEIDTPAHALAITRCFPGYALTGAVETAAMLDVTIPEARALVHDIWAEQTEGEAAAFADCETVHIGGDEYYGNGGAYIDFENELAAYLVSQGKTVRMWACMGGMRTDKAIGPAVTDLCIWNTTVWADPEELLAEGFGLINTRSDMLYLIPGSGYDYLDKEALYRDFAVNRFPAPDGGEDIVFPADHPQIRGAVFVLWNDMSGNVFSGITERDMAERFLDALPVLSYKMWYADGTMPYEDIINFR